MAQLHILAPAAVEGGVLAAHTESLRCQRDSLEDAFWHNSDPLGAFMDTVWTKVIRKLTACNVESFRREQRKRGQTASKE